MCERLRRLRSRSPRGSDDVLGKLAIAYADQGWFEFLRRRASQEEGLPEVNFWSPGQRSLGAVSPGELVLLKLRPPIGMIVGVGVLAHATRLPCSLAWETFREANGVPDAATLRETVTRQRQRNGRDTAGDVPIECRVLTQPVFLQPSDWLRLPDGWGPDTASYKTFDLADAGVARLWVRFRDILAKMAGPCVRGAGVAEAQDAYDEPGPESGVASLQEAGRGRFADSTAIRPRLGQGGFRAMVTDAYGRRCAITGEPTLPVLEAAHIRPYARGGLHDVRNGLLLRSDLHTLFDNGYLTVGRDHHVMVSRQLAEDYAGGRDYLALEGRRISEVMDANQPHPALLDWHNQSVFRA